MNAKWNPIVSSDFNVPRLYEIENFVFKPLTVNDIEEDYQAIIASIDYIKSICTFDFYPEWPSKDMTKAEDLSNLGWHQTEFEFRTSFAYVVRSPIDSEYIGCAYIFPSNTDGYEVDVYTWVKAGKKDLNESLFDCTKKWIDGTWPFTLVNYPNRTC